MTTTTAAKITAPHIGVCRWEGHRFRADSIEGKAVYCPTCPPVVSVGAHGEEWIQRSAIKWNSIKVRLTETKCSGACTSAKSDKCACECGGHNHGASLISLR